MSLQHLSTATATTCGNRRRSRRWRALLALALRPTRAGALLAVAGGVLKFVVPFSALAPSAAPRTLVRSRDAVSRVPLVMEQFVQPFTPANSRHAGHSRRTRANAIPAIFIFLTVWLCGFVAVLLSLGALAPGRRRVTFVQAAKRRPRTGPLGKVGRRFACLRRLFVSSPPPPNWNRVSHLRRSSGSPRIGAHLDDTELEAILAHELCHIPPPRQSASAISHDGRSYLLVSSLVWCWARAWKKNASALAMKKVVRMGGEPQVYAESILKVVEFTWPRR